MLVLLNGLFCLNMICFELTARTLPASPQIPPNDRPVCLDTIRAFTEFSFFLSILFMLTFSRFSELLFVNIVPQCSAQYNY